MTSNQKLLIVLLIALLVLIAFLLGPLVAGALTLVILLGLGLYRLLANR